LKLRLPGLECCHLIFREKEKRGEREKRGKGRGKEEKRKGDK